MHEGELTLMDDAFGVIIRRVIAEYDLVMETISGPDQVAEAFDQSPEDTELLVLLHEEQWEKLDEAIWREVNRD